LIFFDVPIGTVLFSTKILWFEGSPSFAIVSTALKKFVISVFFELKDEQLEFLGGVLTQMMITSQAIILSAT